MAVDPLVLTEVPVEGVAAIRAKVAKVARKAAKLGIEPPVLTVSNERLIFDPDANRELGDLRPKITVADLTLVAPEVIGLSGWTLLGRVDTLPDGTPLVARTPGTEERELPVVTDPRACDHCRIPIRRNETFLVAHEDGRTAQVGRNCLSAYLGIDPSRLLLWYSLSNEVSEEARGAGHGERFLDTAHVMGLAARVAAHGGFLGRAKANEIAHANGPDATAPMTTADRAMEYDRLVDDMRSGDRRMRDIAAREFERWNERYPDDEAAAALLAATMAAAAEEPPMDNEWRRNVHAVLALPDLRWRHVGVAVSAVVLGLRALEIPRAAPRPEAPVIVSRPVGSIGGKVELDAEVTFVRNFDGDWGTRTLMKFRADDADLLWWASGFVTTVRLPAEVAASLPPSSYTEMPFREGDKVHLRGTVKNHETDTYTKRPVTVLTRVKVTLTEGVAA